MSQFILSDLLDAAKEAGISTGEKLVGNYDTEAVYTAVGETKNSKPKITVKWQVLNGPKAGEQAWETINIPQRPTSNDPDDLKKFNRSVGAFIGRLKSLGLDDDYMNTNPSLQDIADSLLGVTAEQELSVKNDWQNFKVLRLINETPKATVSTVPSFMQPTPAAVPTGFLGTN